MADPTAFPIVRSVWPRYAAIEETVNSGAVVAKLTMVAPIMIFGRPLLAEMATAASINQSAPLVIRTRLNRKSNRVDSIMFTPIASH